MKQSKVYIEKRKWDRVERAAYVPSKSQPGTFHFVARRSEIWECDCTAGLMKQLCSHVRFMLEATGEGAKCFYCGTTFYAAGGLDKHHLFRRSTHPDLISDPGNLILLCRKCHDRATNDHKFEENLQRVVGLIIKEIKPDPNMADAKGTISFEATISDVKLHNSKLGDESWTDVTLRALGKYNIAAAMAMASAKDRVAKITFELEDRNQ